MIESWAAGSPSRRLIVIIAMASSTMCALTSACREKTCLLDIRRRLTMRMRMSTSLFAMLSMRPAGAFRTMRGECAAHKVHAAPTHGKITQLLEDYGFAETPDGQEVYFHKNSVVDGDFYKLEIGNEVRLVIAEEEGIEGVQASTVTPIGKHHIVE